MAKIRIRLNSKAVVDLLKSPEIARVCGSEAQRMTKASGMKYIPDVYFGKTRVNAAAKVKEGPND